MKKKTKKISETIVILNPTPVETKTSKKTKYVLLTLREHNGEYEYTQRLVREVSKATNLDALLEREAKTFYGNMTEKDGNTYYFNGGEIAVRGQIAQEISKAEFDVLNRYI